VSAVPLINTGIDDSSNGAFVSYATTDGTDVKKTDFSVESRL
jgi:hypothetical protein